MPRFIIAETGLKLPVFGRYIQTLLRNIDSYVHCFAPFRPHRFPILQFDSSSSALATIRAYFGLVYSAATLASCRILAPDRMTACRAVVFFTPLRPLLRSR